MSLRSTDAIIPLLGPFGLPKGSCELLFTFFIFVNNTVKCIFTVWDGRFPANRARPLISVRDSKEHAIRRRPWNRAFNSTAIRNYEPLIFERTSQLVDVLAKQTGTVDLLKWIHYFS